MKNLFIIIGIFSIVGCANPKKLHKLMDKLPDASVKECSQRFPIKETSDTITIIDSVGYKLYLTENALLSYRLDSLFNAGCDTLYIDKIKEIIKNRPAKVETKYIIKTQESTAKLKILQDSCNKVIVDLNKKLNQQIETSNELNGKLHKVKGQRNWLIWIVIALLLYTFRKVIALLIGK